MLNFPHFNVGAHSQDFQDAHCFRIPRSGQSVRRDARRFADNETVRGALARADEALGFSIERLIAEGPAEELNLTVNTQPAVLASSVAFYEAWLAAGGQKPELLAGHSLGEYSALCAAGVFPLEEAVKLVRFRAEAMQSAVPVGVGGMAAIIGLSDEDVEAPAWPAAPPVRWKPSTSIPRVRS